MTTEVFYFSGTGNSLVVARDMALELDGKLTAIASVVDREQVKSDAEAIGIVFPVYYETFGGIPQIVKRFVPKLRDIEAKYLFAVCTYGSAAIVTLERLARLLESRGGTLSARFAVNMPENIHPALAAGRHQKMFEIWKKNVDLVCRFIRQRKTIKLYTPNAVVGKAYSLLAALGRLLLILYRNKTIKELQRGAQSALRSYDELLPLMDNSFRVNSNCNGCKTCASMCPVGNIGIVDDRPSWQHRCEFCLACFHWCPREAITSTALDSTLKYHHPEARLIDMIRSRE